MEHWKIVKISNKYSLCRKCCTLSLGIKILKKEKKNFKRIHSISVPFVLRDSVAGWHEIQKEWRLWWGGGGIARDKKKRIEKKKKWKAAFHQTKLVYAQFDATHFPSLSPILKSPPSPSSTTTTGSLDHPSARTESFQFFCESVLV